MAGCGNTQIKVDVCRYLGVECQTFLWAHIMWSPTSLHSSGGLEFSGILFVYRLYFG